MAFLKTLLLNGVFFFLNRAKFMNFDILKKCFIISTIQLEIFLKLI